MGRRNTSSTKSGKYMNPTDQVRARLKNINVVIPLSFIFLILGEERGTKKGAKKEQKAKVMCGQAKFFVHMSVMPFYIE